MCASRHTLSNKRHSHGFVHFGHFCSMKNSVYNLYLLCLSLSIFFSHVKTHTLRKYQNKLCHENEHLNGTWEINPTLGPETKKSFYCCEAKIKLESDPLCTNYQDLLGEWNNVTALQSGYMLRPSHSGCDCDLREGGKKQINSVDSLMWIPKTCELPVWDADDFCQLLGNRTILLMGDSTFIQTAYTLHQMIATNSSDGRCSASVVYGRTDRLYPSDRIPHNFRSVEEYVMQFRPSIAVMGAGPHMADINHMRQVMTELLPQIKRINDTLGDKAPTFLWKTIHPGHYGCDYGLRKDGPLPILTEKDDILSTFMNYKSFIDGKNVDISHSDKHRYWMFPTFDEISAEWKERYGYKIINMAPLYLRPDAHPGKNDCLHFCTPGPIDLFSILLLAMLYNGEI